MSKLRIQHFGPIVQGRQDNDGWIDIRKVTLFLGDQGTGKSTVAKVLSTMTWLEKTLVRGDQQRGDLSPETFRKLFEYHRLENYFSPLTVLEYQGNGAHIKYAEKDIKATLIENRVNYQLPQVMYVPAERNFISYIKRPELLKLASDALTEFLSIFEDAKESLKTSLALPFGQSQVEWDKNNETLTISNMANTDTPPYKINLYEASSGYQSSIPLFMVTKHLIEKLIHPEGPNLIFNLTEKQRRIFQKEANAIAIRMHIYFAKQDRTSGENYFLDSFYNLQQRFRKTHLINIVEEPEQNLHPISQREMLTSLLAFNNALPNNQLIMTSHSPFLISILSLAIYTHKLLGEIAKKPEAEKQQFRDRVEKIINASAATPSSEIVVYELENGAIKELPTTEGIPSDENQLNEQLEKCNEMFDELLEIEDSL